MGSSASTTRQTRSGFYFPERDLLRDKEEVSSPSQRHVISTPIYVQPCWSKLWYLCGTYVYLAHPYGLRSATTPRNDVPNHGRLQVCQLLTTDTSAATSPSRGMPRLNQTSLTWAGSARQKVTSTTSRSRRPAWASCAKRGTPPPPTARRAPGRTSALTPFTTDLIPP